MSIMQNRRIGTRPAYTRVRNVSAATDTVSIIQKFRFALVLQFFRLGHPHDLPMSGRRHFHHVFENFQFVICFENSPAKIRPGVCCSEKIIMFDLQVSDFWEQDHIVHFEPENENVIPTYATRFAFEIV